MNLDLTGRVVIVTGASSSIGEVTARLLHRVGATPVLAARRVDHASGDSYADATALLERERAGIAASVRRGARSHLPQVVAILRTLRPHLMVGDCLRDWLHTHETVRAAAIAAHNRSSEAEALAGLARLHHHLGDLDESLKSAHVALALYRPPSDQHGIAEILLLLASTTAQPARTDWLSNGPGKHWMSTRTSSSLPWLRARSFSSEPTSNEPTTSRRRSGTSPPQQTPSRVCPTIDNTQQPSSSSADSPVGKATPTRRSSTCGKQRPCLLAIRPTTPRPRQFSSSSARPASNNATTSRASNM